VNFRAGCAPDSLIAYQRCRSAKLEKASASAKVHPENCCKGGGMGSLWAVLKGQALYVSFAHDTFNFEVSWIGVIVVVGVLILFRFRRR
jgi:hypothetical protein